MADAESAFDDGWSMHPRDVEQDDDPATRFRTVYLGGAGVVAALDRTDFELRVEQAETSLTQARARLGVPIDGSADDVAPQNTALVRQAQAVLQQRSCNASAWES